MQPVYTKNDTSGDYFSVTSNKAKKKIVLEVQENGTKAKVELDLEQCLHLISLISKHGSDLTDTK